MGTSEFSTPTLEMLLTHGYELIAVYTQPDKPSGRGQALTPASVKRVALDHAVEVRQPASLKDPQVLRSLQELAPDVIVVAAYGKILPPQLLSIPRFGSLNIHPSLLPKYRGPSPVAAAILAGDLFTGVTIMLVNRGVDSGPILSQHQVLIEPGDTTASLSQKLARIGARLLHETLPRWVCGSLVPQNQNEGEAIYTRTLSKEQGEINWNLAAIQIWRQVRAYHPWPGCYTRWQGRVLKIIDAIHLSDGRGEPGRVISLTGTQIGVHTGEGILQLIRIQLEGKRVMSSEDFVRGHKEFVGALLPS